MPRHQDEKIDRRYVAQFLGFVDGRRRRMKGRRLPVWYNPAARWVLGITLFDQRVVAASRSPNLPLPGP